MNKFLNGLGLISAGIAFIFILLGSFVYTQSIMIVVPILFFSILTLFCSMMLKAPFYTKLVWILLIIVWIFGLMLRIKLNDVKKENNKNEIKIESNI